MGYSDFEAAIAAEDMENPYDTPYIIQDDAGILKIGEHTYEVRYCRMDYTACGLLHLADAAPFSFYMLIDKSTLKSRRVASYRKAEKKYVLLDWNRAE